MSGERGDVGLQERPDIRRRSMYIGDGGVAGHRRGFVVRRGDVRRYAIRRVVEYAGRSVP